MLNWEINHEIVEKKLYKSHTINSYVSWEKQENVSFFPRRK